MKQHTDPLETELAALRPLPPSPQVAERIALHLKADAAESGGQLPNRFWPAAARRRGLRLSLALAAAVVAASAATIVFWSGDEDPSTAPVSLAVEPPVAAAFDDALPSVGSYRRAWSRSDEEFDRLLSQHRPEHGHTHSSNQIRGFERSDNQLPPFLGGL